jgi:hypothetical protein
MSGRSSPRPVTPEFVAECWTCAHQRYLKDSVPNGAPGDCCGDSRPHHPMLLVGRTRIRFHRAIGGHDVRLVSA